MGSDLARFDRLIQLFNAVAFINHGAVRITQHDILSLQCRRQGFFGIDTRLRPYLLGTQGATAVAYRGASVVGGLAVAITARATTGYRRTTAC